MNVYEDYAISTVKQLRKEYKRLNKIKKIIGSIPVIISASFYFIFGLIGYYYYGNLVLTGTTPYLPLLSVASMDIAVFIYAGFSIAGGAIVASTSKGQFYIIAVFVPFIIISIIALEWVAPDCVLMACYITISALVVHRIEKKIEFMRTLKGFPFVDIVTSQSMESYSRSEAVKLLEKDFERNHPHKQTYDDVTKQQINNFTQPDDKLNEDDQHQNQWQYK